MHKTKTGRWLARNDDDDDDDDDENSKHVNEGDKDGDNHIPVPNLGRISKSVPVVFSNGSITALL